MLYLPQSRSGPLPRLDRFPVRHSIACLNSRVLSTLPYSTRISATAFPFSTPNSRRRRHCRYEEYFAGSSTIVGSRSRSRVLHLIFRLRTDICISQNLTSTQMTQSPQNYSVEDINRTIHVQKPIAIEYKREIKISKIIATTLCISTEIRKGSEGYAKT